MEHHFAPFISTYWLSFSNEHVLNRLLDYLRHKLNNNNAVGAILIDFLKPFIAYPTTD